MTDFAFTLINNSDITSNISDGSFRLYVLLQSYCFGSKDTCFPSQSTLSEKLHKSIRQIQRYLSELIDAKLITKRRRGSCSNIYQILAKKARQVEKVVNKSKNAYNGYTSNKKQDTFSNYSQREYSSEQFQDMERMLLDY